MHAKKLIYIIALYVAVIGALNWGLHACGMNLVEKLANAVGGDSHKEVENAVYYLVALAGLVVGVMFGIHLYNKEDHEHK